MESIIKHIGVPYVINKKLSAKVIYTNGQIKVRRLMKALYEATTNQYLLDGDLVRFKNDPSRDVKILKKIDPKKGVQISGTDFDIKNVVKIDSNFRYQQKKNEPSNQSFRNFIGFNKIRDEEDAFWLGAMIYHGHILPNGTYQISSHKNITDLFVKFCKRYNIQYTSKRNKRALPSRCANCKVYQTNCKKCQGCLFNKPSSTIVNIKDIPFIEAIKSVKRYDNVGLHLPANITPKLSVPFMLGFLLTKGNLIPKKKSVTTGGIHVNFFQQLINRLPGNLSLTVVKKNSIDDQMHSIISVNAEYMAYIIDTCNSLISRLNLKSPLISTFKGLIYPSNIARKKKKKIINPNLLIISNKNIKSIEYVSGKNCLNNPVKVTYVNNVQLEMLLGQAFAEINEERLFDFDHMIWFPRDGNFNNAQKQNVGIKYI